MESNREPGADLSAFIEAQTAPLGRLARSLVGAGSADDLVQDTWTSYLRRPPSDEAPVGGFLATIARRLAWKHGRSEARRRERERFAARSDHAPGPEEFAERASALREVLEVVTGLREPFRSALWQRYFDDLPPREIARRSGESLATVKSRLQRGLELVRLELDRRHGGKRSQWAIALSPLSAAPAVSIELGISGGLLMGSVAKLSAAALVIAGCVGLFLWSNRGDVDLEVADLVVAAPQALPTPDPSATAPLADEQRSAVAAPVVESDPPLEVASELAHPFLYVLVVHTQDDNGLPVSRAPLKLAPLRSRLNDVAAMHEQNGTTTILWRGRQPAMDVDLQFGTGESMHGSRRLHLLAGSPHEVALLGSSVQSTEGSSVIFLRADGTLEVTARLDGKFEVSRVTVKGHGALLMERFPHPHGRFSDPFVSTKELAPDDSGSREGMREVSEAMLDVAGLVHSRPWSHSIVLGGLTVISSTTSPVTVVVHDERGKIVPGALVVLGRDFDGTKHVRTTDEKGSANFEAIEAGWWEARAGGQSEGLARERLFVEAPQPLAWNARLERGASVVGRVLDAQGEPAKNLLVVYESTPEVRARPTQVRMTMETRGGEEVSERGENSPGVQGGVRTPWVDRVALREDGSFELANLPAGLGRLLLVPADDPQAPALLIEEGVLPGEHEYVLRLPERPATIQLRVVLPQPWQDEPLEVRAISEATGRGGALARGEEGFQSQALASGWYRVEVGAGCLGWHDLGRHFVGEAQSVQLADFSPPLPASVRVIAPAPAVVEPKPLELTFYQRRDDLDLRGVPKSLDGSEQLHLPAGEYWVFWTAPDGKLRHRGLTLQAGTRSELDLRD